MQNTSALVCVYILPDLVGIIIGYVKSKKRNWKSIAKAGEYETCLDVQKEKLRGCFRGACLGGHKEIIEQLILHLPESANIGLYYVVCGNHKELADYMISKGATDFGFGLEGACYSGHLELAEYMISLGANDWNRALREACRGGHRELVELMISHGADNWNLGLDGACFGEQDGLVKYMISLGATKCTDCFERISEHPIRYS